MPKYIIHIGPHKTGSSYLQWSFLKFRQELLARGICYPDEWGTINAHHGLVARLRAGDTAGLAAVFDRLSGAGHDTILFSAEDLSGLTIDQIGVLRDLLRGAEATIVFYCRRWSEILLSIWREHVKQGRIETFPEFLARLMLNPHRASSINIGITLARFAEVLGSECLKLVSFNEVLERRDDLFAHFCRSFLAWDSPPLPGFGRVNESLDVADTELIRQLNVMRTASGYAEKPYTLFMELRAQLSIDRVTAAMQHAVHLLPMDDKAPVFAGIHTALMNQFGTNLVPPHRGHLFRPNRRKIEYIGQDYLMQEGIPEAIRDIDRAFLARSLRSAAAPQ